jgi:hypothetical protein
MMREECWKDIRSPEAEKIIPIQISTGSQYLTNDRDFGTAHGNRGLPAAATLNVSVADTLTAEP